MRYNDARSELIRRLDAAGLDPDHLEPWVAWKIFKAYLRVPLDEQEIYDSAAFQVCTDAPPSIYWVRQFSERDDEDDVGLTRVVVEFAYRPADSHFLRFDLDLWTHDFETLEEFGSVSEGLEPFQAMLNRRPLRTRIYDEDL